MKLVFGVLVIGVVMWGLFGCVKRPVEPLDVCRVERERAEAAELRVYLLEAETESQKQDLEGYEALKLFHSGLLRLQKHVRTDK